MLGKLLNLPSIFNNSLFRIPDYQRGYAWTDKELGEFWDDLDLLATQAGQPHYMGVITLEQVPDGSIAGALGPAQQWMATGASVYYVVDGQQRLTTIEIMIFELLRRHESLSPGDPALGPADDRLSVAAKYIRAENKQVPGAFGYRFGYAHDNETDAFLRKHVFEDPGVFAPIRQSAYTQNLLKAKDFFTRTFANVTAKGDLERLYRLVSERLRFNTFEVSNQLDVCMTFEAINNRGKGLSDLEKLKSRLIYLGGLLAGSDVAALSLYRNQINDRWKAIYRLLGWSSELYLDDDDFLNLVWTLYYDKYGMNRSDHLFKEEFFPQQILRTGWSPIDDFTKALSEAAAPWVAMKYPELIPDLVAHKELSVSIPPDAAAYLNKHNRLGSGPFRPLLLAAIIRHQQGKLSDSQLRDLLEQTERYVFLVMGLSDRRADVGRSAYFRKAHDLYRDPTAQVAGLLSAIPNGADGWFDGRRFVSIVREWFEKGEQNGFYRWDELKYVLFEYEESLYNTQYLNAGKVPLLWTTVAATRLEESVEHIYPQTATDPSWHSAFGPSQNKLMLNALGNLLLLSQSKNASMQNRPYSEKAYGANGYRFPYLNGSCSEQEVAGRWRAAWTPTSVCQRTALLLDFVGARWAIDRNAWAQVKADLLTYLGCAGFTGKQ
jgi:hypothetical protein